MRPDFPRPGSERISLLAARGETESFQVVVQGGEDGLRVRGVEAAGPLRGEQGAISAGELSFFAERLVELGDPSDVEGEAGVWPDPLVPAVDPFYGETRSAFPFDVPAGEAGAVWVDVRVPAEANPGTYSGTLEVHGNGFSSELRIELEVIPLQIGPQPALQSAYELRPTICEAHGLDCAADPVAGWRLHALYARAALDNRIGPSQLAFDPEQDDRELFRRWMLPLIEGRPLPGEGEELLAARLPGARPSRIDVTDAVAWWRREASRGAFADRAFAYPCDEPNEDADVWQQCREGAAAARAEWPGLEVLVTAAIDRAEEFGALAEIDILAVLVNQLQDRPEERLGSSETAAYGGFLDRGGSKWIYNACPSHGCDQVGDDYFRGWPSYVIDQPGSQQRIMGPLAIRYRASGELYYALNRRLGEIWDEPAAFGGNGDGDLLYPGTPERIGGRRPIPVESVRIKRIRDGREDHAWLTALVAGGRKREAFRLVRELVPVTYETTIRPAAYERWRQRLARTLAAG